MPGFYHRIEKGQTLWRISKIYNVDLDKIININRISDATDIEIGQLIFIPGHQKPYVQAARYLPEDFIWPVNGRVIANFGQAFDNMINKGINIEPHSKDVVASRSGRVVFYAEDFGYFAKALIIDHGEGFSTVYAGIQEALVKVGDNVEKGTTIARVDFVRGKKKAYLHFEIRKGHIPQNPYYFLSGR
jgi:murein DD-endopeptidase MepM/ murein hydrolase activator NlpD